MGVVTIITGALGLLGNSLRQASVQTRSQTRPSRAGNEGSRSFHNHPVNSAVLAAGEGPSSDFFRDFKLAALIQSNHNISNDPLNEVYVQFEYKDKENDILSCVVFLARDMRNCFHNLMIALNFSDRCGTVNVENSDCMTE